MQVRPINIIAYLLLLVFAVMPLVLGLGYALLYSFGLAGALQSGFTLSNWQKLFAESEVISSFAYSAALALTSIIISVSMALFTTVKYPAMFGKGLFNYIIYLPLAFPAMVAAFFFFQFLSKAGILARLFFQLHIISSINQFPDLVNDRWGIAIIVTQVFLSCPFFILLLGNLYVTERVTDYILLSESLGATHKQSVQKIAIPMLLHKCFPTMILYFIFMFGAYEVPVLLGRSNPEMVSVLAVRKLQRFNLLDIPQGYAIAILYTLVVFVLIVFMLKKKSLVNNV